MIFFSVTLKKKLADKILDNENYTFLNCLSNRVSQSIYLEPLELNEIINSIHSLNMNKSIGHDSIPAFPLKIAATITAPYLQCFFDFSFGRGVFPENGTLTEIIPKYKKGNKDDPNNYRPISILTCFSKILERLIYNRFFEFLKKHTTIYKAQYGFQKQLSITHALFDIFTTLLENVNLNLFTGLVFLDLQKAFDTVSHNVPLTKQEHYGIRGSANLYIKSFLNRKQYTFIDDHKSKVESITYGVAQGSSLGPLLFLLFVNDLPNSISCFPRFFADNTCIVISNEQPSSSETQINEEISKVLTWCNAIKLNINPLKSNYLVIPSKLNTSIPN